MLSAAVTVPGRRRRIVGLAFATPALVAVSLFILLPGLLALVGSLFNIRIGSQTSWRWAGLDNYGTVLADPAVRQAILNTLVYSVITVIPGLVLGFLLALLVHSATRGKRLLQVLLFLPYTGNLVAMGVVFRSVFASPSGPLNSVLGVFGLGPVAFLSDPSLTLPTVALVGLWRLVSFTFLIYFAGLSSIPTVVEEAADMDGVTGAARVRHVLLPLLRPASAFALVMALLQCAQVFDTVRIMTDGGPLGSSETVLTMAWKLGFEYFDLGQAAALNTMLIAVLILTGVIHRRISRRSERPSAAGVPQTGEEKS